MTDSHPEWLARAQAFCDDDPDPETQAELSELLTRADEPSAAAELRDRFTSQLGFGTAGLRGLIGAGDNRMNRRVVAQTTAALCAQLVATLPDAQARGLCIGFDGRHKSRDFAEEARAIANGAGFVVHALEAPAPTPLLAFSVRERAAAGGIMITASHNPAAYNGYKVYWEDGAQLNAPHDAEIAHRIAHSPAALALPRQAAADALAAGKLRSLSGVFERYLAELARTLPPRSAARPPRLAYTAMHGVGEPFARAALARAGVADLETKRNPLYALHDFWHSFTALWKDPQGQISLAVTTLFWGAGATMRLVVIAWAAAALQFGLDRATQLTAMVALGIAFGSVFAARYVKLQDSAKVLPAGIAMGIMVVMMALVNDWRVACCLLFMIGVVSGYFVVPLNALLQHRGHILIGAGHSIAVQNFNENLGILLMIAAYTLMVKHEVSIYWIVVIFGAFVSLSMTTIYRSYRKRIYAGKDPV